MKHLFTSSLFCGLCALSFGQTIAFTENFQSGFPTNWTMVDVDQQVPNQAVSEYTSAWIITSDPDNTADSVVSSTSFFEPEGQANKWLITPPITLGAYGNLLSWRARSFDPSYPDNYKVLVSTTDTELTSFTDTVGLVEQEDAEWVTRTANLSNFGFNNQTIYLAFVNFTNEGFKLFLDDIEVEIENPLTTPELVVESIQLSPNPAEKSVVVRGNIAWEQVTILTMDGKVVLQQAMNNNTFDVDQLPSGVYVVQVAHQSHLATSRLVKK